MSEIPNIISALVDDNKVDAETSFKNTMASKIGDALDLKRIEVANSLIKGQPDTSVEDSADEEI
jgi:hypothetical protein